MSDIPLPLPLVSVAIPCYNYAAKVCRAIQSVKSQSLTNLECIIMDDGSTDNSKETILDCIKDDRRFRYIHQPNQGVAHARNNAFYQSKGIYFCALDADDAIEPTFLEKCVSVLETNPNIGIAYTSLRWVLPNQYTKIGKWPGDCDFNKQVEGKNQVPTCNVARREVWERLGGQRQRYSPRGCGAEDAEMWLRVGACGWDMSRITDEPLFTYSFGEGGTTGNKDYEEVNWLAWHPWTHDGAHPFASIAKPQELSHPARQYDSPLISVIIPVGPGHEGHVIEALDSVEAQTLREWEAIVVWDTGKEIPETLRSAYPYVTLVDTGSHCREWAQKEDGGKDQLIHEERVEGEGYGAGYSRNRGAEAATAPLLLFLDADDFLKPDALARLLDAWNQTRAIPYSDYEAHRHGVPAEEVQHYHEEKRLLHYNAATQYAVYNGRAGDFDWERAQRQPENPPYIWNLISSLVPKVWHDEIGGFDEVVPSWEDWDYWVRLAMAGKPFVHVAEPLVVYLYYTGSRREHGYVLGADLLEYYYEKYQGVEKMGCKGCGPRRPVYQSRHVIPRSPDDKSSIAWGDSRLSPSAVLRDEDFLKCRYTSSNLGDHRVIGPAAFDVKIPGVNMIPSDSGGELTWSIDYGYTSGGSIFLVHRADIELSQYFQPIEEFITPAQVESIPVPRRKTPAPPRVSPMQEDIIDVTQEEEAEAETATATLTTGAPQPLPLPLEVSAVSTAKTPPPVSLSSPPKEELHDTELEMRRERELKLRQERDLDKGAEPEYTESDLQTIPGISPSVARELRGLGITTQEELATMSEDKLKTVKGIGEYRARMILDVLHGRDAD